MGEPALETVRQLLEAQGFRRLSQHDVEEVTARLGSIVAGFQTMERIELIVDHPWPACFTAAIDHEHD